MVVGLLGGKCIIKFEGSVVTIYIFFHLKCLTCVLTRIWLERGRAWVLTLSVGDGPCFLFIMVVSEPVHSALMGTLQLKGLLTFIFFLSALALVVFVQPRKLLEG